MELHVDGLENRNYLLQIKNLLEKIDASKSNWKVKKGRPLSVFLIFQETEQQKKLKKCFLCIIYSKRTSQIKFRSNAVQQGSAACGLCYFCFLVDSQNLSVYKIV